MNSISCKYGLQLIGLKIVLDSYFWPEICVRVYGKVMQIFFEATAAAFLRSDAVLRIREGASD